MKVLSIKQPWASLICAGIKDVENRTWKPKNNPGKILIHASCKKAPFKQMSEDIKAEIYNAQLWGWIPPIKELPKSAIIGYIELNGFSNDFRSIWAHEQSVKWIIKNAFLFKEPIKNIKGKLNLFEVEMDNDMLLNCTVKENLRPYSQNEIICLPICNTFMDKHYSNWKKKKKGDELTFGLSTDLKTLLNYNDNKMKEYKVLKLFNETKQYIFNIDCITLKKENLNDNMYGMHYVVFKLGEPYCP